jgi:hypothetical protein
MLKHLLQQVGPELVDTFDTRRYQELSAHCRKVFYRGAINIADGIEIAVSS